MSAQKYIAVFAFFFLKHYPNIAAVTETKALKLAK